MFKFYLKFKKYIIIIYNNLRYFMTYYSKEKFNITTIIVAILVLGTIYGIVYLYTNSIEKMNKDNIEFKIKKDSLNLELKKMEQISLKKDKMKFQLYCEKISGIKIPDSFSHKELLLIYKEAKKYKLDVSIILRLIKAESSFRSTALSSVGAAGYMQLMPRTYNTFFKKLNLKKKDNYSNIKVGIYYIKYLKGLFKGYSKKEKMRLAILSYNYGPTRVKNNIERFLGPEFDSYVYLNKILKS